MSPPWLKEFEPSLSHGGDMAQNFLAGSRVPDLKSKGEKARADSLAKGMPHGYEVGYRAFSVNGRSLGHGRPIKVKAGQRVLFHVLNASATEIRSLALPGHTFKVTALDGNPVPRQADVPVLWRGTAERVSALVEMNHPGVWVLGDLSDDDRNNGMGTVVEYAGRGSTLWTLNGVPFNMDTDKPVLDVEHGKRYRCGSATPPTTFAPSTSTATPSRSPTSRGPPPMACAGRRHARRLPAVRLRRHRRPARTVPVPLPSAAPHGLRGHDSAALS